MYTYNDLMKMHALPCLAKAPTVPDTSLFIGEAEQLHEQPNIQLYAGMLQPAAKALIEPNLKNRVEDLGDVGDGLGIVSQEDFLHDPYYLGTPLEGV